MFGVEAVSGKLTSKHVIQNPWFFNFFWTLSILIFTIPFALWNGVTLPVYWTDIILASFFFAASSLLYTLALYKVDVSVIGSLYNFRTVITVVLGALFFKEILTLNQYLLIALIVVAGLCISIDERFSLKSFFSKGVTLAILGVASSSLMAIFIKRSVDLEGYWTATLWIGIIAQIWLLPTFYLFKKDVLVSTLKQYGVTIATAVLGVIGTLTSIKAYAMNVSLSSAIIAIPFSFFIAVAFSRFAPQLLEKHSWKVYTVRFVSATVMFIAAIFL